MKKYALLFFSLGITTTIYTASFDVPQITFSDKVYYRYYLIKRTEKNIQLLVSSLNSKVIKNLDHFDSSIFQHKITKKIANTIIQQKTILPIKDLWGIFSSYHLLDDDLFVKEFVQQIFILYSLYNKNINTRNNILVMQSAPQLLDYIDQLAEQYNHSKSNPIINQNNIIKNYENFTSENIAKRFYIINRMQPIIQPLLSINTKDKQFKKAIKELTQAMATLENTFFFSHNSIQTLVNTLCTQQTIRPIQRLWSEIKGYQYILNETFIKEALIIILLLYRYLSLEQLSKQECEHVAHETIATLNSYSNTDITTIDKIFEDTESIAEQFISMQADPNSTNSYIKIALSAILTIGIVKIFFT